MESRPLVERGGNKGRKRVGQYVVPFTPLIKVHACEIWVIIDDKGGRERERDGNGFWLLIIR